MRTVNKKRFISLALAVSMFFSVATANAAKCKYNVDTVNHRTGEKVRWTKWNTFRLRQDPVMLAVVAEGDRKYLALRMNGPRGTRTDRPTKAVLDSGLIVQEGANLLVLMADESVLELHAEKEVVADSYYYVMGNGTFDLNFTVIIKYELDDGALTELTSKRLKVLRLSAGDEDFDFEFGDKGSDRVSKALVCIQ